MIVPRILIAFTGVYAFLSTPVQGLLPSTSMLVKNTRLTSLFAGMGMGVANKKKKSSSGPKTACSDKKKSSPFDAAAALLKLEKKYGEISSKAAKVLHQSDADDANFDDDLMLTEFIVAARSSRSSTSTADLKAVADWIPVAQLAIARKMTDMETSQGVKDPVVKAAVSYYCREISQAAIFGSPKFRAVPRQDMLYSVEAVDSFHKFVSDAINGKQNGMADSMTKAEARKILNLEEGATYDKSDIKQSYRKLSFSLHPDRFVGIERTDDEIQKANDDFAKVKMAFDTLSSGINNVHVSWYESLGGKERMDFLGPLELFSMDEAKSLLENVALDSAICGLSPDLVQMFVLRNQNTVFTS
jgi:DnaJ domain